VAASQIRFGQRVRTGSACVSPALCGRGSAVWGTLCCIHAHIMMGSAETPTHPPTISHGQQGL
jgi:hypothetical protein